METPKENWDIFKPHAGSTETETMGKSLIKSDNTKTLQNALEQIEKLEAEKEELLEALEMVHELVTDFTADSLMLIESVSEKAIQKHKK